MFNTTYQSQFQQEVFPGKTLMYNQKLAKLAMLAQPEPWTTKDKQLVDPYIILRRYLSFTYDRLYMEKKVLISSDDQYACFNTGLLTMYDQDIIGILNLNRWGHPRWFLCGFYTSSSPEFTSHFSSIPEPANYCTHASELIYDATIPLQLNKEHIISDNFSRFCSIGYSNKQEISEKLDTAKIILERKAKRNFRLVLPFYYLNKSTGERKIQLLAPLYGFGSTVKLALVIDTIQLGDKKMYEAKTVLPLEQAYINARVIAKPETDWRIIFESDHTVA